jgi:hypothetical protein
LKGSKWLAYEPEADSEIEELVDRTERSIQVFECGISIDWETKDFLYFELFKFWKLVEKELESLAKTRMKALLERPTL